MIKGNKINLKISYLKLNYEILCILIFNNGDTKKNKFLKYINDMIVYIDLI
jgi:hypothetical protein